MPELDHWLTTPPKEEIPGKCECGHEYEDHYEDYDEDKGEKVMPCTLKKCPCEDYDERDNRPYE